MIKHILTLIWNKKKSNFLLFLEIFFSFMILFAVLSFIVSQARVYTVPLGFDTEDVWMVYLEGNAPDADTLEVANTKKLLYQELNSLSEISDVSFTANYGPFMGNTWSTGTDDNGFELQTDLFWADEFYAKTGGLNVTEGRWFVEGDDKAKYNPVVITNKLREECFKGKPVIDSLFILDDDFGDFVKIVGVVDHYKYHGEFDEERAGTFMYAPNTSMDSRVVHLRMQKNIGPEVEQKVNDLVASVTKKNGHSIRKIEEQRIRNSKGTWTSMIALLCISGFLILNVALGLLGVLWFNISKRRSEIGLRRAIGATGSNVSTQFVGEVIMVTLIGILFGIFFAAQFPLMKLFDTENINYYYGMLLAAGIILLLVFICSLYPSMQAAKISPAAVLHED